MTPSIENPKQAAEKARQQGGKGAARCPSCSQNADDKNVLVRCAQRRATSATPIKGSEEG